MTINEIQDKVVADFSVFDEWMDKYEYLIELGKKLAPLDEKYYIDQNLINGCQSKVWLNAELIDGKIIFTGDSDAIITKGLVSLIISVFTDHSPSEILSTNLYFIDKIGLQQHLSPTRSNGLLSMIRQIKLYALSYSNMNNK